jgi:hypothetical protein
MTNREMESRKEGRWWKMKEITRRDGKKINGGKNRNNTHRDGRNSVTTGSNKLWQTLYV